MILVLEMFISKGWLQYILNIMLAFFCGKVNSVGSQEYMSTSSFCTTESTGGTEGGTCDNPDEIAMGVTLREFKERYGQDIYMFHADEISCDEDYTTRIFRYDTSSTSYEVSLICEYTGSSK